MNALLDLSSISLGCVTFGREIGQEPAFALMDHALARGVKMFDTAAVYGQGASERIVGAWRTARGSRAERVLIATKAYPPYTPGTLRTSVEASCRNLGMVRLGLFLLHTWDATAEDEATLATLDALVREGVVGAVGASNFNAAQLGRALAMQRERGWAPFRLLQNNQNLAVRDVDEPLRVLCREHGVAIVTYSPLGAGFLTGKHAGGVQPGSRFAVAPGHQQVYFNDVAQRRLKKLTEVSLRTGHPMTHLALAWAMHQSGTASVLIGGRMPAHLDQAFAALALDDPALFAELESA